MPGFTCYLLKASKGPWQDADFDPDADSSSAAGVAGHRGNSSEGGTGAGDEVLSLPPSQRPCMRQS